MAEIVRRKSDGQVFARLPGDELVPLNSAEEVRIASESTGRSLFEAIGNSTHQISQGAQTLLGVEGAREQFDQLQREAQLRRQNNPLASMAGSVVPDVAAGLLTGGTGGLARQVGTTALTEGLIGGARNPDNPLTGAALQGGVGAVFAGAAPIVGAGVRRGIAIGDTVVGGSRARAAGRAAATPTVGDSVNAARNSQPTFETGNTQLRGYATPEQLTKAGFKINPTERAALEATTREELETAIRTLDRNEVVASTNIFGPLQAGDLPNNRWARDDHRASFVNYVGKQVGEDSLETLTRRRAGEMLSDQQQVFKDLIDNNPNPIKMDAIMDGTDGDTFLGLIQKTADDAPVNAQKQLNAIAEKVTQATDADGVISPANFRSLHKEVSDSVRRNLTGQSGNRELGFAMAQVKTALDDAAERVITKFSPRQATQIAEARKNYGIIMATLRGKATDPDGMINPKTFANNYAKYHPGYARGKTDTEFSQVLDAAIWLTHKRTPESGTGARIAAAAGKQLPTAGAVAGGGGLLGLFSE